MQQFNLLAATRTIEKSMPFVLYRLLLCLGVSMGYLVATLAGAGTAVGVGSLGSNPTGLAPFGALLGFAGFALLMFKVRAAWLRSLKAVHWALLAEQEKGTSLPEGKAQIDFAKTVAGKCFPGSAGLLEANRLITSTLKDIAGQHPPVIGAGTGLAPWITRAMGEVFALNRGPVLAWNVYSGGANVWKSAAAALPVLAHHFSALLKYRLFASLFEWVGFIAAVAVLSIPFNNIAGSLPFATGIWAWVFALLFGWTIKAAFFEPIGESVMMQSLFPLIEKERAAPDSAELLRVSAAFGSIAEHAKTEN